jgi:hypothetical protein
VGVENTLPVYLKQVKPQQLKRKGFLRTPWRSTVTPPPCLLLKLWKSYMSVFVLMRRGWKGRERTLLHLGPKNGIVCVCVCVVGLWFSCFVFVFGGHCAILRLIRSAEDGGSSVLYMSRCQACQVVSSEGGCAFHHTCSQGKTNWFVDFRAQVS